MKKYIIAVLVLTLVGGAAAWYYLRPPASRLAPSRVLPQSTLLAVELVNLEQTMDRLRKGTLAQKLRSIDVPEVMAALDFPPEKIEDFEKGIEAFLSTVKSPLFRELFGQKVALALLPPDEAATPAGPLSQLMDSAVLVSRPRHRADLVELLTQAFTKNLQCATQRYGDHEIKSLAFEDGFTLHYAQVEDLLVASCSLPRLHSCLDLTKPGTVTLAALPSYCDLSTRLAGPTLRGSCFLNMERVSAMCSDLTLPQENRLATTVPKALALAKAFLAVGAGIYDDGTTLLRSRAIALTTQDHAEMLRPIFGAEPQENRTLAMATPQPLFYHWGNSLDLQALCSAAFAPPATTSGIDRTPSQEEFEHKTGVQLKDLLAAFGNQYALLITSLGAGGPFPIPSISLMLKVVDEAAARRVMDSLVQQSRLPVKKKIHGGIEITYLNLPFGKVLQPAYAFLNGFCVVSLSRTLLKDMITALQSTKGITTDSDFRLVTAPFSGNGNSLTFIRVASGAAELQEIMEWVRGIMALRDPNTAPSAAALIDGLINPVLECMKEIQAIGSRTVVRQNEIEAETNCEVVR